MLSQKNEENYPSTQTTEVGLKEQSVHPDNTTLKPVHPAFTGVVEE